MPFKSLVVGCLHFQGEKGKERKKNFPFFKGSNGGSPDVGGAGKNFWANFGSMFSASQSGGGGSQQGFCNPYLLLYYDMRTQDYVMFKK